MSPLLTVPLDLREDRFADVFGGGRGRPHLRLRARPTPPTAPVTPYPEADGFVMDDACAFLRATPDVRCRARERKVEQVAERIITVPFERLRSELMELARACAADPAAISFPELAACQPTSRLRSSMRMYVRSTFRHNRPSAPLDLYALGERRVREHLIVALSRDLFGDWHTPPDEREALLLAFYGPKLHSELYRIVERYQLARPQRYPQGAPNPNEGVYTLLSTEHWGRLHDRRRAGALRLAMLAATARAVRIVARRRFRLSPPTS